MHHTLRRRFVGLLGLATVLAVAGLAGCGGQGQQDDASTPPAQSADEASTLVSDETGSDPETASAAEDPTTGDAERADDGGSAPTLRALPPAGGVPSIAEDGPRPVGLDIPALNVDDSVVRPVGVEDNGEFEVPIASEVGWYRFGSGPGEEGSTVMAAHIAYDGEDGVFRNLSTVENGSLVNVELDDGSTLSYKIVDRVEYNKTQLPFDDIFSESGPDRLVLITCGGEFNPELRSYESNVVAYAELVS